MEVIAPRESEIVVEDDVPGASGGWHDRVYIKSFWRLLSQDSYLSQETMSGLSTRSPPASDWSLVNTMRQALKTPTQVHKS
jgi:hypothetical protein